MQRLLTYVLAMGCVGTSAMFVVSRDMTLQNKTAEMELNNNAAYRDGLYLGKLAQAANHPMRPPVGRWATAKDRASFAAGFQQGSVKVHLGNRKVTLRTRGIWKQQSTT